MRIHTLKTWPSAFEDILSGNKTFEYRRNDRDFAVGDQLVLREWDPTPTSPSGTHIPDGSRFTGRRQPCSVTHILHGGQFGVPEGYCIMSIVKVE